MTFWKESIINRLSNLIYRNRSAAKISQVLCSNIYPLLLQLTLGVDCEVDEWSSWTPCSLTCGGGTKNRTKDIVRHPVNLGAACPKDLDETEDCKCIGSLNHETIFP